MFVMLLMVVILAFFLAFKESSILFCLSLVLADTKDLEDWENLLQRCVQEIVIIGYQQLCAFHLLELELVKLFLAI